MARRKVKPLSAPGSQRIGRSLKDGHLCGYCRNRSRILAIRRQHIKQYVFQPTFAKSKQQMKRTIVMKNYSCDILDVIAVGFKSEGV